MKKEEIKKVDANCTVEVYCTCPYCDAFEDVFEDVREGMDEFHQATNCDVDHECSNCGKTFIVDNVHY